MQVGNAAFAGQEPNYSNDRHPLSVYSMAKRLTGGSFQEFLQLRRDRNACKSDGSGHSVTNLLRGRGLSLARSGLTASDMPRRLASTHDCLVHRAEKLFALSFFRGFVFFRLSMFP